MRETGGKFGSLLGEWVAQQRRGAARYTPVHDLVFGRGALGYFLYRTRNVFIMVLFRTALHIIEFSLLIYALPTMIYPAMLLRLLGLVLDGGWWGATERMRQRIRTLKRRRDTEAVRREITGWVTLSSLLALAVLAAGGAVAWQYADTPAYAGLIAAIALQLALRIVSRTFYSGAYAVQRVFMPIEFLIVPEILVFVAGMFLHPWMGEWSVSICIALSGLLVAGISFRNARQVTDFLRITPGQLFSLRALSVLAEHKPLSLLTPALAALGLRLHGLILIIVLQAMAAEKSYAQELLFSLYLVMPLLRGASGWSQALYLDLSRFHLDVFAGFRRRLERAGLGFSILLSAIYATLAAMVIAVYATTPFAEVAGLVAAYMLVSGVAGFVLMSLFARRSYAGVIVLAALQYVLLATMPVALAPMLLLSALLPAFAGMILLRRRFLPPQDTIVAYMPWAAWLRRQDEATAVFRVTFHPRAHHAVMADFIDAVLAGEGHGCICGNTVLLACKSGRLSDIRMIAAGAGYISGIEAIDASRLLAAAVPQAMAFETLAAEFTARFPAGIIQYPGIPNPVLMEITGHDTRRGLLHIAQTGLWLGRKKQMRGWFVTTAYDDPWITAMFIVPKATTDMAGRSAWRALVDGYNVARTGANTN